MTDFHIFPLFTPYAKPVFNGTVPLLSRIFALYPLPAQKAFGSAFACVPMSPDLFSFFIALIVLLCTAYIQTRKYAARDAWGLAIWMTVFSPFVSCMAYGWKSIYVLLFGIVGAWAFLCDWHTRCFSKRWLIALWLLFVPVFFAPVKMSSRLMGQIFTLCAWLAWREKKMGSADVILIACAVFVLGLERMMVCVLIACLQGFVYIAIYRRDVPFASFLLLAFWIALCRGYSLFSWLTVRFM